MNIPSTPSDSSNPIAQALPPTSKCRQRKLAKRAAFQFNWRNIAPANGKPIQNGNNEGKRSYKAAVKAEREWARDLLKKKGLFGKIRLTAFIAKTRAEAKRQDAEEAAKAAAGTVV
jgi:hypothetical protein